MAGSPTFLSRWALWLAIAGLLAVLALASSNWLGYAGAAARLDQRYAEVRAFIAAGDWKQANSALSEIMLLASGRESEGWFDPDAIERFPCSDLAYIELLYARGSSGRFGFEAQLSVWQGLSGSDGERFLAFAEAVGWRQGDRWLPYEELGFGEAAPRGHLPAFYPEPGMRSPFKTRKGAPEERAALQLLLDERFKTCLLLP